MPQLPLPKQSETLSTDGFAALYARVRANPANAKTIADMIEADPRGSLEFAFRLTEGQKAAIKNTPDAELRRRASVLVDQLRSPNPGPLTFSLRNSAVDALAAQPSIAPSCSCSVHKPSPP